MKLIVLHAKTYRLITDICQRFQTFIIFLRCWLIVNAHVFIEFNSLN